MANVINITYNFTIYESDFYAEIEKLKKFDLALWLMMFILGTCANLWMIVCIWKSPNLRVKFRAQLICNLMCVHLLSTSVVYPLYILSRFQLWTYSLAYCHIAELTFIFHTIINFLGDWLLVTILAVFLAQVLRYDLRTKLSPTTAKLGCVALHLWPWVVATGALLPPLFALHDVTSTLSMCVRLALGYEAHYEIASTIIPLAISIVMVVMASAFRLLRLRRGIPSKYENMETMESQPSERNAERDSSLACAAAVALAVVLETLHVLDVNGIYFGKFRGLYWSIAAIYISETRPFLMVFPWLLLPDVRERIRTWRPWRNSTPSGIDLTVVYTEEA